MPITQIRRIKNSLLVLFLAPFLACCANAEEAKHFDPEAPKAHHTENGYRNLYMDDSKKPGLFEFLFDVRLKEDWPDEDALRIHSPTPRTKTNLKQLKSVKKQDLQITWIGHSTLLIQYNGLNILTDPMFSDRASPLSFAGPKRYMAPAFEIENLPPIDAIVISHNHYDHMDEATIKAIGNGPKWFVPLGNAKLLAQSDVTNVVELDWWEGSQIDGVSLTLTPTQHWSGRSLFDRYETLWGSWAIKFDELGTNIWFGGDTGYNDVQFKQIGDRYGPFDLSFIPIGAYAPRWFMQSAHVNPEEAVQIHQDIKSSNSIGIHWGTFALTSESVDEPPKRLVAAAQKAGLRAGEFVTLPIGGTKIYSQPQSLIAKQ